MNKVELLAPAGNLKKLKIALAYGADAVYGGVKNFSLRSRSSREFTYDSFKQGVDYAHSLDKKIYATINGFPFDSQIKHFKEHIAIMADIGVDGFIISTPGVLKLSKEIAPRVPLHLSTQANVLNRLDAKLYHDLGAMRIVTAREMSLKDLKNIKKHIPTLELEIFVHGSMCFAFSGRCLISSIQSGRIPNRGSCANDCRFEYDVYVRNRQTKVEFRLEEEENQGTHIFNAKDLNLASHIHDILDNNIISSFKIEGRTKSSYYVGVVTNAYRTAIDDYYDGIRRDELYQKELHTTKHRGFSDGYLIHRPFNKLDSQNFKESLSSGSFQVCGEISNTQDSFMCKHTIYPNEEIEILSPKNSNLQEISNEIGNIYKKNDKYFLKLKTIKTIKNKELLNVHSGNENPIKLPCKLPLYSFLRKQDVNFEKQKVAI